MPTRDAYLAMPEEELAKHCRQEAYRASGPGGQHRNKTDSAVRVTLVELGVTASATDHRSQHRNRVEALKRLRLQIALEVRCDDAELWPGPWKLGRKDYRYPRLVASVLDVLAAKEWAVGAAAKVIGLSTGRMIRLLANDPQLWDCVNHHRQKANLITLRRP